MKILFKKKSCNFKQAGPKTTKNSRTVSRIPSFSIPIPKETQYVLVKKQSLIEKYEDVFQTHQEVLSLVSAIMKHFDSLTLRHILSRKTYRQNTHQYSAANILTPL